MEMGDPAEPLARRLGFGDAVVIGLGSMIGAGVFAAIGPAAAAAGSGLLVGLVVAAVVAYANATSSAQLAAAYPQAGGTYVYGRAMLGPAWGFVAGWGFVVGKTASLAAMALTVGAYAAPGFERVAAVVAVAAMTTVNYLGVEKTAGLTKGIVAVVLASLAVLLAAAWTGGDASGARLADPLAAGPAGILEAAGILFFAFAGYARIATLGEEVIDPERVIPRAIPVALAITLAVYVAVAASSLAVAGPEALAASAAPLATAAGGLAGVVRVGGTVAALGVLLSLLAGTSRTVLAMARNRELPSVLAAVHPVRRVPHRAEVGVGLIVIVVVAVADVRGAIGFSSFCVLVYYGIANLSALRQPPPQRRWPRSLQVVGLVGCATLAFSLPPSSVLAGIAVLAVGSAGRWLAGRR